MKKLFITSDWHLDWHTDGYERFDDVATNAMSVVQAAVNEQRAGEEVIFGFLGDLTNPHARNVHRAMAFAVECACILNREGVHNVWLPGNHDVIEDGHNSSTLLAVKALERFDGSLTYVLDEASVYQIAGLNVLALPFTAASHAYDPVFGIDHADVVLGHLHIPGIVPGSETNTMPRGRSFQFPLEHLRAKCPDALLINGHYHEQQVYEGIHIPGSLVQLTHSEEENTPGYLVFELEGR